MTPKPKTGEAAQVGATAVGSNLAAVALHFWNKWQMVEKCTPLKDVCEMVPTRWHVGDDIIYGLIVANIAWIISPLMKKYQKWANNGKLTPDEMRVILTRLEALEKKEPNP